MQLWWLRTRTDALVATAISGVEVRRLVVCRTVLQRVAVPGPSGYCRLDRKDGCSILISCAKPLWLAPV